MSAPSGPPAPHPRVGVRQVAERAGVSTQTVSRVLNGHPHIREETRQRVLEAMAALDYRVNNAARALGTRSTRTLGVIAAAASLYGPAAAIAALERAARAAERWVVTAYADAGDPEAVQDAVDHLLGQGVDGIALVALHAGAAEAVAARAAGIPVVSFEDGPGLAAQRGAAGLAVSHLVEAGHRRIARLAGPADWAEEDARSAGVGAALAAHGLPTAVSWRGDWSAASGAALAADVADSIRSEEGPTALVVANDQMALGVISGLVLAGLDVPADVSVTGFDDNPDAAYYRPALTTVRVDLSAQAHRCVAAALGLVAGEPAAGESPPVLVVRASTAAPPR